MVYSNLSYIVKEFLRFWPSVQKALSRNIRSDLELFLRELDTGATVYRLKATAGSLLRTVKVTFSDQKQLNKLLVEGLTVAKYNMLFRVEKPFVTVLPQHF